MEDHTVSATVRIPARILHVDEWSICTQRDLRRCPGVVRGTEEWEETYKIRTSVERSINHIKDSFCLGDRKTQNAKTLHADLLLAGITQLITVVVAERIHKPEYFRSLKRLIA